MCTWHPQKEWAVEEVVSNIQKKWSRFYVPNRVSNSLPFPPTRRQKEEGKEWEARHLRPVNISFTSWSSSLAFMSEGFVWRNACQPRTSKGWLLTFNEMGGSPGKSIHSSWWNVNVDIPSSSLLVSSRRMRFNGKTPGLVFSSSGVSYFADTLYTVVRAMLFTLAK